MGSRASAIEKRDNHLAHASNLSRDLDGKKSSGIAEGRFPNSGQEVKEPQYPEQEPYLRRSRDPDFVEIRSDPLARRRRVAFTGLIVVLAAIGAAVLLFIADEVPHQVKTTLVRSADEKDFMSRFAGDITKNVEHSRFFPNISIASAATQSTNRVPSQLFGLPARVAAAEGPIVGAPTIHGVTDKEIRLGIAGPFTGAAKELGNQMRLGIETTFNLANDAGGINGRQVKLVVADDGYEPTRTADSMRQLYEKQQVFGFVGNVGTPTAMVALPYALEHHALFFGAFTGADLLRRDPPDRYVFNYRASYAEETDTVVRYLVNVRKLRPDQIAVFAQHDAFGDAGFSGVAKAIRALRGDDSAILRLDYERNTVDVDNAVAGLRAHKTPVKAVVMVAAYRAAAKFIEKTRDLYSTMIYTNVSFVGSTALASELMLLGPRYASGVIVTQVVPAVDSYASAILKYKTGLAKYFPGEVPDYVSLEGYVDGSLLLEGLKRAGQRPDTESLVDGLETLRNFDMGLGTLISFSQSEHQGSHKVWGTQLDDHGHYQPVDLQ